jgi:patatin-like phospholipase/acyl hydrolase
MTERSPRSGLRLSPDPRPIAAPMPFRILALSGGGYRGLFSAEVAAKLDTEWSGGFNTRFDLFAGTSIGGLIAAGLATGKAPAFLRDAIKGFGPEIFDDTIKAFGYRTPFRKRRGPIGGALRSKFDRAKLEEAIDHVLGDDGKMAVVDIPRPLVLVATCATTKSPFVMTNISRVKTPASTLSLRNALLATSAAPGYFPALDLATRTLVDGGLVANAPDLVAIGEVLDDARASLETLRVLSIGTAGPAADSVPMEIGRRGLGRWLIGDLVPLTLEAQEQLVVRQASALLGERFKRIDAKPAPGQAGVLALDLATPDATRTLLHLADESLGRTPAAEVLSWLDAPLMR